MNDNDKTKEQLVSELAELRHRISQLEAKEATRKQMKEALWESEKRFRSITETASDAIIILNSNGYVFYWNDAARNIFGYSMGETRDKILDSIMLGQFSELFQLAVKQVALTGTSELIGKTIETMGMRRNGEQFPIELSLATWRTSNATFFTVIARDITKRRQAEDALEKAYAELVRQERLSTLGQLTATVAHEIRNPLGTVRTAVFAIGDAIEQNEMHRVERARQLAERNIVRCDRIIRELLDYTRDRALNLRPILIDPWLSKLLDEQNIPESITCTRELTAGIRVPLDDELFRRAVINVVENAIQAMLEQESTDNQLTISTRVAKMETGFRVEILVRDTGPGIHDDVFAKVFEPLFSTKNFGIGLGLSIVKNIVEQHSGNIEIESKTDEGTIVRLWLPIINVDCRQSEEKNE
ncbi:MAG: PAS domain S-box protein [Chloroflexi bacterium]|nr:PAS domain S-box protein [Chloroflexota bacterium]